MAIVFTGIGFDFSSHFFFLFFFFLISPEFPPFSFVGSGWKWRTPKFRPSDTEMSFLLLLLLLLLLLNFTITPPSCRRRLVSKERRVISVAQTNDRRWRKLRERKRKKERERERGREQRNSVRPKIKKKKYTSINPVRPLYPVMTRV